MHGQRKHRAYAIGTIQNEQLKLVKVQQALEGLVGRVKESINVLKVEELQLKSSAVTAINSEHKPDITLLEAELALQDVADPLPHASTPLIKLDVQNVNAAPQSMEAEQDLNVNINKQEIDLDMFVSKTFCGMEEEEEEE